ncbi:hypothetical protein J2Y45_004700 [Dyadobacter sp. BE34]|uniref:Outer membrane protein beta-barrel domain-containing protein n=1 Tax=Dyadobacter fermentans TaxID=94254 RepID=A0ABU1R3F7_9BACT|nr:MULTISPECIES: hypothetical protein [Dyadobacter]MDR6807500.1 hypothetical protein [Dyadobacter fermentans]MDR7045241.1 hypothetical protein [Dyadobacter sp. BE242]MDR7199554.1 hypothetical protein [Dyadobacter sp. BE34]MDR7217987.1 hypothetical protein [Dyadobacter sp. BE31]MDR7265445.1 hypothetical protein [Dyadobacter sp. BE32]
MLSPALNPQNRRDHFAKEIGLKYGNKYYTSISSGSMDDYMNDNPDPIVRGSAGPSYKIERNCLVFIGRMMVGVVSITSDWGSVRLKEKGTNELLNVRWDTQYPTKDCFSFHPSLTFAYRVSRRITFNLDLDSWFYKADITYKETTRNALSGNVTTNQYRYSHFMSDLSAAMGIMIIFK